MSSAGHGDGLPGEVCLVSLILLGGGGIPHGTHSISRRCHPPPTHIIRRVSVSTGWRILFLFNLLLGMSYDFLISRIFNISEILGDINTYLFRFRLRNFLNFLEFQVVHELNEFNCQILLYYCSHIQSTTTSTSTRIYCIFHNVKHMQTSKFYGSTFDSIRFDSITIALVFQFSSRSVSMAKINLWLGKLRDSVLSRLQVSVCKMARRWPMNPSPLQ